MDSGKVQAIRAKAEALAGESLGDRGDALVEMACQRALAHCQREDIPEAMEQAVAALALSMAGNGQAKTIQRGDTAITFDTGKVAAKGPESLLAPFCRLGRVR